MYVYIFYNVICIISLNYMMMMIYIYMHIQIVCCVCVFLNMFCDMLTYVDREMLIGETVLVLLFQTSGISGLAELVAELGLGILVQLGTDCMLHPCLTVAFGPYWNILKHIETGQWTRNNKCKWIPTSQAPWFSCFFPFPIGNES